MNAFKKILLAAVAATTVTSSAFTIPNERPRDAHGRFIAQHVAVQQNQAPIQPLAAQQPITTSQPATQKGVLMAFFNGCYKAYSTMHSLWTNKVGVLLSGGVLYLYGSSLMDVYVLLDSWCRQNNIAYDPSFLTRMITPAGTIMLTIAGIPTLIYWGRR